MCRFLSWDDYFMAVAFLSAQRSKDPNKQVRDPFKPIQDLFLQYPRVKVPVADSLRCIMNHSSASKIQFLFPGQGDVPQCPDVLGSLSDAMITPTCAGQPLWLHRSASYCPNAAVLWMMPFACAGGGMHCQPRSDYTGHWLQWLPQGLPRQ